jgi:hypothetical protein
MATATRALTGSILIRIGNTEAQEVATFEVPVVTTFDAATMTATLTGGDVRGAMAHALRATADRLEADERDDADS